MTTPNNDATSEFTGIDVTSRYPELDVTSTLPTTPEPTLEMPSTDPLAIFREEDGATASGSRTAFDPAFTGETTASAAATSPGASQPEAGAGSRSQDPSGTHSGATGTGPGASGAQTWSAPAWPVNYHDLPEAPSRGVRVGAFVWALLVCMVGAFLIGLCEEIIKGLGQSTFSDAFTFALLIIVLCVKPTGLFGEKVTDKV